MTAADCPGCEYCGRHSVVRGHYCGPKVRPCRGCPRCRYGAPGAAGGRTPAELVTAVNTHYDVVVKAWRDAGSPGVPSGLREEVRLVGVIARELWHAVYGNFKPPVTVDGERWLVAVDGTMTSVDNHPLESYWQVPATPAAVTLAADAAVLCGVDALKYDRDSSAWNTVRLFLAGLRGGECP